MNDFNGMKIRSRITSISLAFLCFIKLFINLVAKVVRTRLVWGLWRGSMGSVTLLWQRNSMGGARSDV